MRSHFLWIIFFHVCVLASDDDASQAHLSDHRLDRFFSTRTSLTADMKDIQRNKDEKKAKQYQHKKQIDVDKRNSLLALNIDSRYPDFQCKAKRKPSVIRELDRAKLSGVHLQSVNAKAEIVSPKAQKKMNLPPNFSHPLPNAYESTTEYILQEYLGSEE